MEIFIFSPCLHRSFRELKVSVELAPVPPQNQITEVSKSYALTLSVCHFLSVPLVSVTQPLVLLLKLFPQICLFLWINYGENVWVSISFAMQEHLNMFSVVQLLGKIVKKREKSILRKAQWGCAIAFAVWRVNVDNRTELCVSILQNTVHAASTVHVGYKCKIIQQTLLCEYFRLRWERFEHAMTERPWPTNREKSGWKCRLRMLTSCFCWHVNILYWLALQNPPISSASSTRCFHLECFHMFACNHILCVEIFLSNVHFHLWYDGETKGN